MQESPVEIRCRNINSSKNRKQSSANVSKLSDVKRTNALLRKLKEYKSENQESILTDVTSLNLKRYVSECCSAIVCSLLEGRAKISDVEFLGVVCSHIHQCYDDVEREILTLIKKKWDIQLSSIDPTENLREVTRNRAMIRFLCEIYRIGITAEWRIFRWFLQNLLVMCPEIHCVKNSQVSERKSVMSVEKAAVILGYLNVFVRSAGGCLFHALPWPEEAVEPSIACIAQPHMYEFMASSSVADEIGSLIVKFIDIGLATLELENHQLKEVWIDNMKAIKKIGDLPESLLDQFGSQKRSCERLYSLLYPLAATFPDSLRHFSLRKFEAQKVPSLEELFQQNEKNAALKEMSSSLVQLSGLSSFYSADCENNEINVYDSVSEQQFYEEVSPVSFNTDELIKEFNESKYSFTLIEEEAAKNIDSHIWTIGSGFVKSSIHEASSCRFERVKASAITWTEKFLSKELSLFKYRSRGDRDQGRSFLLGAKKKLYRYIRDAIWSTEIDVVEISYVLAVLAQTRNQDLMDMGERIYQDLETTLLSELSTKSADADKIASVITRVQFFCEGMKFRLISTGPVMGMLSILTEHHVIGHDKALARCLLIALNSAGRFLARHPVAQHKFEQLLQVSSRSIRSLGGEMEIQLAAAISNCLEILRNEQNKESASTVSMCKRQPPKKRKSYEEQYLRFLVYTKLSESSIDFIVNKFLSLDWTSFENQAMVFNILRKSNHVSFQNIPLLATIVRKLSDSGIDYLEIYIVDNLIEKSRQNLENGLWSTTSQKKFSDLHYFVELFNVGIVQESTLFYVLHMICLFSLSDESIYEYSRIRIIGTLLEPFVHLVKKHKGNSSNTIRRLRFFLYHFYILIHSKAQPFPIELNFSIGEIFDSLRKACPSFYVHKFPESLSKAQELMDEVLARVNTKGENQHSLSKDPVNSYRYFFLNTQVKEEIHPINEKCVDFGGIEEKEVEYERPAAEDLEASVANQIPSSSKLDISNDESQVDNLAEAFQSEELADRSTDPFEKTENLAEASEFDKLLKDMTKESFSTIRQQNTLKAMSGRRVSTNQSLHLKNLRKVRETEISNQTVDAIDSPGGTVSVAVAIRNKAKQIGDANAGMQSDPKVKGQSRIDFRVVHIPNDTNIATQQQLNIQEKRRERDELRRTTQSMVSAMDHEPSVV
ncbi:ARM repeat-containing protein [Perkinsela sp. CCAP 1560/4]|nr:ARM repeat-containing protein [Perkinsela sp. CCAP 1560/4]|eukprot:KNH05178.1 ARM repeat-containing protein [Perkinsela sp. CCAP 1560/4]